MRPISYLHFMADQKSFLTLKIDTDEPVELADFVGSFTSIGNEFERFIAERYPDHRTSVQFFVREVRTGCIEADLFGGLSVLAGVVTQLDQMLILEDFVKRWGSRFTAILDRRREDQPKTKGELKDWSDAVSAIARDPNASHRLAAATFEDGRREQRAVFTFNNPEAMAAQTAIQDLRKALEAPENMPEKRVLMTFTRPDIYDATVGKRSGERVKIESISDKSLAIMYGSEIAEQQISAVIRDTETSVFAKGFVVDVSVQTRNKNPVAYSVTNLHEVLDLPEN